MLVIMKKSEIFQLPNVTKGQKVSSCYWKMTSTDLLDTELKKVHKVKSNKNNTHTQKNVCLYV